MEQVDQAVLMELTRVARACQANSANMERSGLHINLVHMSTEYGRVCYLFIIATLHRSCFTESSNR